MTNNHENLFEATKPLELPTVLRDYILFSVSLDDDKDEFYTKLGESEKYTQDDTKCCLFPVAPRDMFH